MYMSVFFDAPETRPSITPAFPDVRLSLKTGWRWKTGRAGSGREGLLLVGGLLVGGQIVPDMKPGLLVCRPDVRSQSRCSRVVEAVQRDVDLARPFFILVANGRTTIVAYAARYAR
jgi:hypothetical protein